jgi:N-acetylglucosaminyldiphosphoundecaprenol N-acetyl-beta-D-mannosaminyltransferase
MTPFESAAQPERAMSPQPEFSGQTLPKVAEKKSVLGILIDPVNYETAVNRIVDAARQRRGAAISALAVHGVMTGVNDPEHKYRLNSFDLLVPDGQPVRWMLNLKHGAGLRDRVYGPKLTLKVCERAAAEGLPVFFYGSTPAVLESLQKNLLARYPGLIIAGTQPSKFRHLTPEEKTELVECIVGSRARIVFVGLGCPRQEIFAYEFREALSLPLLAVGAAFPFIAGKLEQAPPILQDWGLEWLFRFKREPRRLWRRYLLLNPAYVALASLQFAGVYKFSTEGSRPEGEILFG